MQRGFEAQLLAQQQAWAAQLEAQQQAWAAERERMQQDLGQTQEASQQNQMQLALAFQFMQTLGWARKWVFRHRNSLRLISLHVQLPLLL